MRSLRAIFCWVICAVALMPFRAPGVVIYNNANGVTSQPVGDQGWSFTGGFENSAGVAIAPHFILTAAHLGIESNQSFTLNGVSYPATAFTGIANTDLMVVQVSGTIPSYAQLYSGSPGSEVGQTISMIGAGHYQLNLASPITSTVNSNTINNGWQWGGATAKSYGTNVVAATGAFGTSSNFLDMQFNPTAGNPNPAMYTYQDSGGGNFIFNNGVWQLAGITYGIDTYYQSNGMGGYTYLDMDPNGVAIYNANGLYENTSSDPQNPNIQPATDIQENGFATEVAPYISQIDAITGTPEPTGLGVAAIFTIGLLMRRRWNASGPIVP